jgi:serine/threonine protein kinase
VTSIKGANILVDNKGRIKLADFGASKKVVKLATISEAKSMKGTPYWMTLEVIRQTGHNWQANSVGCTVIEIATGKPPWSQQFQELHCSTLELQTHTLPSLSIFLIKARIFSSPASRGSPH